MIVLVKMTGGDDYMSAVFSAVKLETPGHRPICCFVITPLHTFPAS